MFFIFYRGGGRAVQCIGFENRRSVKTTEGSNPSLPGCKLNKKVKMIFCLRCSLQAFELKINIKFKTLLNFESKLSCLYKSNLSIAFFSKTTSNKFFT